MDVIKCEKSPEQMVRSRLPALRRTAATAEAKADCGAAGFILPPCTPEGDFGPAVRACVAYVFLRKTRHSGGPLKRP